MARPNRLQADSERLLTVGDGLPLELVRIPGGAFMMGSPEDEAGRMYHEGPQHSVTVPSFYMGRYPVTQAQWRIVTRLPRVNRALDPDPSHFKGDARPVEQVSWHEAVECCDRLADMTGTPYRLPTEAEWEYACRAGTTTPFHFGPTLTTDIANYDGHSLYACGGVGAYREETTLVDTFFTANAFGLSDMHGNVLEWCQDHWHDRYDAAPRNGSAWVTEDERAYRIARSGSWLCYPRDCRSASRTYFPPGDRYSNLGFRVVCSVLRG